MPEFGSKLRDARERRGLTLRQVADRTKISVPVLEALERDDMSRLPSGIFARSFVRAYAVEVGLDADSMVRELVERFSLAAPPEPLESGDMAASGTPIPRVTGVTFTLLIAGLVAAAVLLFLTLSSRPDSQSSTPQPESSPSGSSRPLPVRWTVPSA
jgi:cytoskeletal protein RodZ